MFFTFLLLKASFLFLNQLLFFRPICYNPLKESRILSRHAKEAGYCRGAQRKQDTIAARKGSRILSRHAKEAGYCRGTQRKRDTVAALYFR